MVNRIWKQDRSRGEFSGDAKLGWERKREERLRPWLSWGSKPAAALALPSAESTL